MVNLGNRGLPLSRRVVAKSTFVVTQHCNEYAPLDDQVEPSHFKEVNNERKSTGYTTG